MATVTDFGPGMVPRYLDPTSPAWADLAHVLHNVDATCRGRPEWTTDTPEAVATAMAGCATCPLWDLCDDAATELRPTAGVWAGVDWTKRPGQNRNLRGRSRVYARRKAKRATEQANREEAS